MAEEHLTDLAVIAMHYSDRISMDKICHSFVQRHIQEGCLKHLCWQTDMITILYHLNYTFHQLNVTIFHRHIR